MRMELVNMGTSNWDLGFELKINWDLELGTPHQRPHI